MKSPSDGTSIFRPIRVGLVGFDEVTALHLIGPADTFVAAALDDGYGGRIPCYEIYTIGVFSDRFRAEDGLMFESAGDPYRPQFWTQSLLREDAGFDVRRSVIR